MNRLALGARHSSSAPGRIRTCDRQLRRLLLCPLSYGGQLVQTVGTARRHRHPPVRALRYPRVAGTWRITAHATIRWRRVCRNNPHGAAFDTVENGPAPSVPKPAIGSVDRAHFQPETRPACPIHLYGNVVPDDLDNPPEFWQPVVGPLPLDGVLNPVDRLADQFIQSLDDGMQVRHHALDPTGSRIRPHDAARPPHPAGLRGYAGPCGPPDSIGAPGFEPGTSSTQSLRANQAALRPEGEGRV